MIDLIYKVLEMDARATRGRPWARRTSTAGVVQRTPPPRWSLTDRRSMSLLREAERCLASQKTYAGLNAFITPLHASKQWLERVRDADARRESGRTTIRILLISFS